MKTISPAALPLDEPARVVLVGNPNAGKTTLFNKLTGIRAKTANFPGTTIELRSARVRLHGRSVELADLPGTYSLTSALPEEQAVRRALLGGPGRAERPSAVILLLDATRLERNLYLASQVLELGLPTVVALNMMDLADRDGVCIDVARLETELGCPVVPLAARNGFGMERLRRQLVELLDRAERPAAVTGASGLAGCEGCPFRARFDWAESVGASCLSGRRTTHGRQTERLDNLLTHPVLGVVTFLGVMFAVFAMIFWIAQYPMGWIERGFALAASAVGSVLADGLLKSLLVQGVIGGVGGVLVFLPQICVLFLLLTLLEDTGYLARAAFVMDRMMRRVGLPGQAFVPMLSAHACAVPALMATRPIQDRRDRLITIFVLPLLTCSARIPIFAILTALLFPARPLLASLVFTLAYAAGVAATLGTALLLKRSILPGETRPLVLELPGYKLPSLRTAVWTSLDQGRNFIKTAGTIILVLSIGLWALATFPRTEAPRAAVELLQQAQHQGQLGLADEARESRLEAGRLTRRHALAGSIAGRVGQAIEPAIRPLGFDWQIGVGVLTSFAAREVIVSTLAIIYGVGEDGEPAALKDKLKQARRSDGRPVFSPATCVSLLVFYVLALQCMSTVAVVRRETGGWRWPLAQLAYMSVAAYAGSFVAYQLLAGLGLG